MVSLVLSAATTEHQKSIDQRPRLRFSPSQHLGIYLLHDWDCCFSVLAYHQRTVCSTASSQSGTNSSVQRSLLRNQCGRVLCHFSLAILASTLGVQALDKQACKYRHLEHRVRKLSHHRMFRHHGSRQPGKYGHRWTRMGMDRCRKARQRIWNRPLLKAQQIYALTYVKLGVTVFKYIPQIISNHRRESTAGWSIIQILLDMGGSIFSFAQLIIDCSLQADWSGLYGNPVKLGLSNISLLADIVFMLQHFVLYRNATEDRLPDRERGSPTETDPLMSG